MIEKPIPYGRQHITAEDIEAVISTLQSDYLTQGPKIKEFEEAFASYVGARYAVAVNNATAGLHLAAKAFGVKPGDKVIVTPMTFAASARQRLVGINALTARQDTIMAILNAFGTNATCFF